MTQQYSDERLNAYLDGELELDECLDILKATEMDAPLRARLARLRATRALMQHAYASPPPPPAARRKVPRARVGLAAGLSAALLLGGVILGWTVNELTRPTPLVDLARVMYTPAQHQEGPLRVMLHITSNDPHRLRVVLSETKHLLATHDPEALRIEIVANGPGLQLLNAHASPALKDVQDMQREHKNLVFLACRETLARVERESGRTIELIEGTGTVRSAFDQVIQRQREGWAYLQI